MAKTTRRSRREARRRLGELVNKIFIALEQLGTEALDLEDQEALACCTEAYSILYDSLTPDGLPTVTTVSVIPDLVKGPLTQALRRVRPHVPLPAAENAA